MSNPRFKRPTVSAVALLSVLLLGGLMYHLLGNQSPGTSRAVAQGVEEPRARSRDSKHFDTVLDRWRALLIEMRDLDVRFRNAPTAEEEAALKETFDQRVADGEVLVVELIDAAVIAWVKSPEENPTLQDFLLRVVGSEMQAERYESALRVAQLLIDNELRMGDLYNVAGAAAFYTNDFKLAEKHLNRAKELKALNDAGKKCLRELPYYLQIWPPEKALRADERAASDLPRVVLETNKGEIELELFENEAPNTVASFIGLVEGGFYDGLTFHRVIQEFMAQGGCPLGDGQGGPGYRILSECFPPNRIRPHLRGSLAMALTDGKKHTAGSQFYLTFVPQGNLDGQYTVFGRIVRGLDVLARLQRREPRDPMEKKINPHRNIIIPPADVILKARVLNKRNHRYKCEVRLTGM